MTEENDHIMTLKKAIDMAHEEGRKSRDAEVERLKDALECVRDTKIRSCLALTPNAKTCRDCFSSRLNWCPACIANAALAGNCSNNSKSSEVARAEVKALCDALIECAEELADQVNYRYGSVPDERQAKAWWYAMRPVRNAHAAVSKSRGEA